MNTILSAIVLPFCAYLLGSIPFGLLIVLVLKKVDIRQMGSGNIGATNVKRAAGKKWALITLICDLLKGFLPTYAAMLLFSSSHHWVPSLTALAAITGHMHPVYLKFRPSGKGVATTLGCLLPIAPLAGLISLLAFLAAVFLSRRVSVGSLTGIFILPPAVWFTTRNPTVCTTAIIIMVLILVRHKDNIQRLANGCEPTIEEKK